LFKPVEPTRPILVGQILDNDASAVIESLQAAVQEEKK